MEKTIFDFENLDVFKKAKDLNKEILKLLKDNVGIIASAIATNYFGANSLGNNLEWLKFLASAGAVFLTFLAGADSKKNLKLSPRFRFISCSIIV